MLEANALILIAHSNWPALIALYRLLDSEGLFVAPCFTKGDLLRYCGQYKPELILTSNSWSDDEGGRFLERIREQSPKTRILLLPEVAEQDTNCPVQVPTWSEDILKIVDGSPLPSSPFRLN